ncbi:hypothetical protein VE04_02810 [Pseudogymnoascus sp. 24MN13]|nr:hypothetical protein VE04_02810 [Pseudogymnoascus sp. 24MN13]
MFQLNGTQFLRPLENITQNVPGDVGSFSWTVQTNKDLSVSNMFYLCLFVEGESASAANSHYFNITGTAASAIVQPTSTAQSTSSTETTGPTHTTSSTIADTSTPTSAAESTSTSSTDVASPPPAGMSVGVKAGIGIGRRCNHLEHYRRLVHFWPEEKAERRSTEEYGYTIWLLSAGKVSGTNAVSVGE